MNIKLQRVVRTPLSEEIVVRDVDQPDRDGAPRTIGKLDVHYTDEGVYGTLLLIDELTGAIGVAETYNIELYCPDMKRYKLYSNLPEE